MEKPRITSAVLVEKDNKFLLAERNKENYKGYWIISRGVKFGETIEEAAICEIKEETNLDVEIIKLIGHKEVINVPGDYHSIVFFHLAKPKHSDVSVGNQLDISKASFFTIDEIKKMKLAESAEWALKEAGFWK
ncbi:NUDIX domain-containing protein [Candidatus Pacearchaeota archaeon]|nr:NUDIX domain-containing protein [Candidatus Pacearchaeota archaeon]